MKKLSNLQPKHQGRQSSASTIHPLPIVIENLSGFPAHADAWPCYYGIFTGQTILVPNKDDADALHKMGCFGNMVASKLHMNEQPSILRQRQYDRRKKWSEFLMDKQAKNVSSESEEELEVPDISELRVPAEDEDVVGHEEPSEHNTSKSDAADDVIVDEEVRIKKGRGWFALSSDWVHAKEDNVVVDVSKSPNPSSSCVFEVDDDITILSGDDECNEVAKQPISFQADSTNASMIQDDDIEIINDEKESPPFVNHSSDQKLKQNDEEMLNATPDEEQLVHEEEHMIVEKHQTTCNDEVSAETTKMVIVIKDTDCLGSKENLIKHWDPKLVPLPFNHCDNSSTLSLEEAFFLSWALNCLQISASKSILCECENTNRNSPQPGPSGLQINEVLIDLMPTFSWTLFSQVQPSFPARYAVYHHLRSKGWVVKSGSKFGGDFVIYKHGPSHYHASSVVVVESDINRLSWQRLLTLNRIAETTSKEVVICKVSWQSEYHLETISWLSKVTISDRVLKRHSMKKMSNGANHDSDLADSDNSLE